MNPGRETVSHQLKLMDSKCRFCAGPDEHIAATSCLSFFGPQTRTPMLDPLQSNSIPTPKQKNQKKEMKVSESELGRLAIRVSGKNLTL